ncbi:MAG TPA: DUF6600 domain-containing protein [Candidatus Dormibacteraeota bacterium]|nr:DUF6600 domain-containing protein [Candidatus Dormibacteraeota bacterium]
MRKTSLKLLSLFSFVLAVTFAMPQRAAADDDDPPSRVARLSQISGSVSFNPAGTDDWVDAVPNRPLTTGDKLWADRGARAEVHLGAASLHLSSNTGFSFLNLTDDTTQIQLTEGTVRVRVKRLDENETFEIDTPNLAFSILRPGVYKISVDESGDTTIVQVRAGEGEVTGGGSAYTVHAHETGTFSGSDQLNADVEGGGYDDDDFDRWSADRDRQEDHSVSARYVSDDVIGYQDLDDAGGWRPVPEYGTVWFPHVTIVGWAPYRYGHWAWVSPWGWTWVDDASWGFAPFHYGRWVTVGGVWGWVPCGPRAVVGVAYVRPVYAPALVAWVGGGRFAVGVSVGGGGPVGWFPLGPREVFVPSYRVSRNYVTNVNVSNTTVTNVTVNNYYNNVVVNKNVTVTNVTYANRASVTATSGQAFTSAQPVGRNMVKVDAREVASASVVATTPEVAPQQRSVLGSGAAARVRPPAAIQQRTVVAKAAPPPPPAPFVKQQQAIQANGGHPIAVSENRQLAVASANVQQQQHPSVRVAPPARPATPQNVQANRPGQPQGNAQGNAQANTNRPGNANQPANQPQNRPQNQQSQQQVNPNRPNNAGQNQSAPPQGNQKVTQPNTPSSTGNPRINADRPPLVRPTPPAPDPQLEQKHQQQVDQLRQKQDQERQKVEQQQQQQQQKIAQQRADQQKQQQAQQKQQQQLEQLEHKHDAEQQKLQQQQQQERARKQNSPSPKDNKKQDKPPKDDKPHNR